MVNWILKRDSKIQFFELGLSKRAVEVIESMINFADREELANYLGIDVNSLKPHVTTIYSKLGLTNQADFFIFMFNHIEKAPPVLPDYNSKLVLPSGK